MLTSFYFVWCRNTSQSFLRENFLGHEEPEKSPYFLSTLVFVKKKRAVAEEPDTAHLWGGKRAAVCH